MSKRSVRRKKNQRKLPVAALGLGVLLLAIGVYFSAYGKSSRTIPRDLSAIPQPVNYPSPALTLQNVKGGSGSLADFLDHVVLVNNWATWCPPCKAELPTLVEFYEAHAAQGFMIVGVEAGEPASDVSNFVRQYHISYPVWLDPANESLSAFGNPNLPNSYVIDRTGTVRLAWTGEITRDTLEKYVTPLIQED